MSDNLDETIIILNSQTFAIEYINNQFYELFGIDLEEKNLKNL